jgi:serine/threonine-protein kinase
MTMGDGGVPKRGAMLAGKYRVDRVLGTGGMGVVVAALHVQLDDEVAIKLLRADLSGGASSAERLVREARAATKIKSEHVTRVFDVGTLEDGSPYIAMERLRGSDFATIVEKDGALAPETVVDYVLQACEAVVEAHALGMVHRDLKPANLFLTHRMDGGACVKVLDFGVSKILAPEREPADDDGAAKAPLDRADDTTLDPDASDASDAADAAGGERAALERSLRASLTGTGAHVGSPRYMAPEQVRAARNVDARADVWALGAILYELCTGQPPFDDDDGESLARAILEREPSPASTVSEAVPRGLSDAIAKALAKSLDARFQDVAALASAIAPFGTALGRTSAERIARVARVSRGSRGEPLEAESAARLADGFAVSQRDEAKHATPARAAWKRTAALAAVALVFVAGATAVVAHRPDVRDAPPAAAGPAALSREPNAPETTPATTTAKPSPAQTASREIPASSLVASPPRKIAQGASSGAAPSTSTSIAAPPAPIASPPPAASASAGALHLDPGALFDGRH